MKCKPIKAHENRQRRMQAHEEKILYCDISKRDLNARRHRLQPNICFTNCGARRRGARRRVTALRGFNSINKIDGI
jgi:hypothetical protein